MIISRTLKIALLAGVVSLVTGGGIDGAGTDFRSVLSLLPRLDPPLTQLAWPELPAGLQDAARLAFITAEL